LLSRAELTKKFGGRIAETVGKRMYLLKASECLAHVDHRPPTRRHQLKGNREGQFAVALDKQWRLVFRPENPEVPRLPDGGVDLSKVIRIEMIGVEDYH